MDHRIALKPKTPLCLCNDKGEQIHCVIEKEIGRGGSCIVYEASRVTETGDVSLYRVKEFYPYKPDIKRGDDNTLTLADVETGKTVVSKRALEEYIADIAQEVYGIYGVKVAVTMEDKDTIDARIKASLEPGVNVFEITEEVKDNVKETIKKVVGLEVKNIEMNFKKIKSNGKEKV